MKINSRSETVEQMSLGRREFVVAGDECQSWWALLWRASVPDNGGVVCTSQG